MAANSADDVQMLQQRASIYEASRVFKIAADSERMIQLIVSIDGVYFASKNTYSAARMIQQRAARDEATCASEN